MALREEAYRYVAAIARDGADITDIEGVVDLIVDAAVIEARREAREDLEKPAVAANAIAPQFIGVTEAEAVNLAHIDHVVYGVPKTDGKTEHRCIEIWTTGGHCVQMADTDLNRARVEQVLFPDEERS